MQHSSGRPVAALPSVEALAPGLWSVPLPLPIPELRYVYVYIFTTAEGTYLGDAGWDTDESYDALERGLAAAGTSVQDVQGIMVTHSHPDHYGMAGRIREESGCWVGLHPAEAELAGKRASGPHLSSIDVSADLMMAGAPTSLSLRHTSVELPSSPHIPTDPPDRLIADGDRIEVPGWDVRAVWTPGHTPGHLCFALPDLDALLTGDHLLPRITPNIGTRDAGKDPLGDFLSSLDRVESMSPSVAYPAHEYRFAGVSARARTVAGHHAARLDEVEAVVTAGPATEWQIAQGMTWSRAWEEMDGLRLLSALEEARAHIIALAARGVIEPVLGRPRQWRRAMRSTSPRAAGA